ncbi:MAG: NACHT domain-containing protein [Leptolyngbyaceae bacterium]|nr:NACHT domain-containing protein [Leptolyngbyaceae bacterium]
MAGLQPPPRQLRLKEEFHDEMHRIIDDRYGSFQNWEDRVNISRTTRWRFLSGRSLSFNTFEHLCDSLGYEWHEIGESADESGPLASVRSNGTSPSIDVQFIRESVSPRIAKICGTIQLFGQPIPISRYVELSVFKLETLFNRRYESLAMLGNDFTLENYNRELGTIRNLPRLGGLKAAQDSSCILVYGLPGSGKTSYLKWLATQCNEGNLHPGLVPVFLLARNFSTQPGQFDLASCIADFLEQCDVPDASPKAFQLLQSGKIILFIDGLDELPEEISRYHCRNIAQTAERYDRCRFIFSCRLPLLLPPFRQFEKVLVYGFDSTQRQDFAREWFMAETDNATALNSFLLRLKRYKPLGELARTPLLMELLCRVFNRYQEFPPTRADLYSLGIEDLLYREQDLPANNLIRRIGRDAIWNFLRKVATDFFTNNEPMVLFERQAVLSQVEQMLLPIVRETGNNVSSENILEAIEVTYGLLVTHSYNFCSFSHLTFQEYFTADHLVLTEQHDAVLNHVTDPKWRFVIELVAELLPTEKQESFFNQFKQKLDDLVFTNHKLCDFVRWVDWMSRQVLDTVETTITHRQTLLRAWYFTFTLKDVYVTSNVGRQSSFFLLPDFDMATSTLSNELLTVHALFYRAFHATKTNRYQVFERAVAEIRESIQYNLMEEETFKLKLLNQIDGWVTVMQKQKAQSNHPVMWWESYREYWRNRISSLMESLHGLRANWDFSEEEEQQLIQYYVASRLLSICTIRAMKRLSRQQSQKLTQSLLSVPSQPPPSNDEFVGY